MKLKTIKLIFIGDCVGDCGARETSVRVWSTASKKADTRHRSRNMKQQNKSFRNPASNPDLAFPKNPADDLNIYLKEKAVRTIRKRFRNRVLSPDGVFPALDDGTRPPTDVTTRPENDFSPQTEPLTPFERFPTYKSPFLGQHLNITPRDTRDRNDKPALLKKEKSPSQVSSL